MSKYRVLFGPYFSVFSPDTENYRPEKTPYLENFCTVLFSLVLFWYNFQIWAPLNLVHMKKQYGRSFSPRRTQVSSRAFLNCPVTLHLVFNTLHDCHCVKSVQIQRFFWSVFSCIWVEYGGLRSISPYSVQIQENTDKKNLHVWTLFTQCVDKVLSIVAHEYIESIFCSLLKA